MPFPKPKILKNGEKRADYIRRRRDEGARREIILEEINSEALFSDPAGAPRWGMHLVYEALKPKPERRLPRHAAAEKDDPPPPEPAPPVTEPAPTPAEAPPPAPDSTEVPPDGGLTAAEKADIRAEAREKVSAEKRKQARELLLKQEMEKLRGGTGMTTGNPALDELVEITVDVAEYTDRITMNLGMNNERIYLHGRTYKVPRHVANTLREMSARSYDHQNEVDGKAKRFRRRRDNVINGMTGVVADGPTAGVIAV